MEKLLGASWRVYAAGILGCLGQLFPVLSAWLDGDPTTNPDWKIAVGSITTALALFGIGRNGRDDKVSSEKAAAEPGTL